MAVKNKRVRIYKLADTGTDGRIAQGYALEPGDGADFGFWAAIAYISGTSKMVGQQIEHTVLYEVTMSGTAPLVNTDDAVLVVLPDETQILEVSSVAELFNGVREKSLRCIDVSDKASNYTLTN